MAPSRSTKLASSSSVSSIPSIDENSVGGHAKGSTGMRGVKRTNSDMQQSTLSFSSKKNLPPTPKKTPSSRHVTRTIDAPSSQTEQDVSNDAEDDDLDSPASSASIGMMSPPTTQPSPTKQPKTDKHGRSVVRSSVMLFGVDEAEEVQEELFVLDENRPSVLAEAWKPLVPIGRESKLMIENLNMAPYPESDASCFSGDEHAAEDQGLISDSEEESGVERDDEAEEDDHVLTPKYKIPTYTTTAQTGTTTRRAMITAQTELEIVRSAASTSPALPSTATKGKTTLKGKKLELKSRTKDKGKDEIADVEHEHLDPKDRRWEKVFWEANGRMGGNEVAPIHCTPKSHTRVHHILRVFDLSPEYGPAIGVSRLQRWQRAEEWGLNPPAEIKDILLTLEGAEDPAYRENVFYGTGIYATN